MNELYENTINTLDEKKNTHPNIIKIWDTYLKYKKKNFMDDMNMCIKVINKIEGEDLSVLNILSLYILLNNRYT
tara:strand:- start:2389 stop:2610 length:222 start_codon:yes stop_codon:yes gene_type:complete